MLWGCALAGARISRFAALPILGLTYALYPLVLLLDAFTRLFRRGRRRVGTEEQIRALTTLGRKAGYSEADEGVLVHKAFILNDRTAADIMTPRADIASLRLQSSVREAADIVMKQPFSRYPVFGASLDDFRGVVLARDLLEAVARGEGDRLLESVLRDGLEVDATRRSDALLLEFRLRRTHLAVVRRDDDTIGLVTLEDVLEELVGEISDETDVQY